MEHVSAEFTADASEALYMISCCSQEYPCFTAWRRIHVGAGFYALALPWGSEALMKSDPSFIKIQRWGLVIKRAEEEEEVETRSHLR